jgi:hypothetical protein
MQYDTIQTICPALAQYVECYYHVFGQLTENLGACDIQFSEDELKRLDKVSEIPSEYPQWLTFS